MPTSEYGPRLNFLRDSASSLGTTSPSTAAYLMGVHNRILFDDLKPLNPRQQESCCSACGTIRTAETNKTIHIKKKKSKQPSTSSGGTTIYQCLRCHRRATKPQRKEPLRSKAPKVSNSALDQSTTSTKPANETAAQTQVPTATSRTTDNASSKKRAKARKQGGLQALLASKQQSQPSSSSLDLFDFLQ